MNSSQDNFNRRRFLKRNMTGILTTGVTGTFSQTNWGNVKPVADKPDPGDGRIIRL